MSNYTPLDLTLFIREGNSKMDFPNKQKDGFDRLFFPFSILVLLLSLSFYAIRLVIDITGPALKQDIMPAKAPIETVNELSRPTSTPAPVSELYEDINGIRIDKERMLATAEAQYPSLSRTQLIDLVNKSLIEWAALRQYYSEDATIGEKLSLNTTDPVATFGAVLRDLGILAAEYDKSNARETTPISALIDSYTENSLIR
ncbi:hypothetical protein KBB12_01335 [Candidatus Woesebacteria bacterium]|nr:hypothetical protein [Candidatus Woesebacteria bacterium]